MAVTKTIIQNSPSRTTIKISADAAVATGAAQIFMNLTVTASIGTSLTFVAGANGVAKITRQAGSWVTDITTAIGSTAATSGGSAYGGMLQIDTTNTVGVVNASNKRKWTVIGFADTNTSAYVYESEEVVSEVVGSSPTVVAKFSDVGFNGQSWTTPSTYINRLWGSSTSTGVVQVKRNSANVLYFTTMYTFPGQAGFVLTDAPTSDIDTIITVAGGFVVYEITKNTGFNPTYQDRNPT